MTEFALCVECDHGVSRHGDAGCTDCACAMSKSKLLMLDEPEPVNEEAALWKKLWRANLKIAQDAMQERDEAQSQLDELKFHLGRMSKSWRRRIDVIEERPGHYGAIEILEDCSNDLDSLMADYE